ncbi:MAG: ParA family protein [Thermoanaerobaculia bacterium]
MRVVATYNLKGGVGKTSTAVNLSYLAARDRRRTLLWDLDPQGAASYCFRIRPRIAGSGRELIRGKLVLDQLIKGTDFEGLDLLPADFSYRKLDIALDAEKKPSRRVARLLAALVERMSEARAPLPVLAPSSPASRAYEALWSETVGRL